MCVCLCLCVSVQVFTHFASGFVCIVLEAFVM